MSRASRGVLCWILAFQMAVWPSITTAQVPAERADRTGATAGETQPGAESGQATASTAELDFSYIPANALAAIVAWPRDVLTSPQMELMPIEVLSAVGLRDFGIDPLDIEQLIVSALPPGPAEPGFAGVALLAKPYQLDDLRGQLVDGTEPGELDGKPCLKGRGPMAPWVFMPDAQTLMVGQEAALRAVLASHAEPADGPLTRLMRKTDMTQGISVVAVIEPIRPLLSMQMAQAPVPPPLAGVKRLPELIDAAKLDVGMKGQGTVSLVVLGVDEAAAEELEKIVNDLLDFGQQMAMAEAAKQADSADPVERASAQYAQRVSGRIVDRFRPTRKGRTLRVELGGDAVQSQTATIGILVALLLPAVQAARTAARRAQSMNNLKQLALAVHNYHASSGKLPAQAICDDEGKPLLSWRVKLLPYLEQQGLYEQFHLDEPWDSPHNRKLIEAMPPLYRSPMSQAEPGKTNYLVPAGEGTMFEGSKGKKFVDVTDGLSNTIMILEVDDDEAVTWTKPDDWELDPEKPLAGLGGLFPEGFNAAFADGQVRLIVKSIDPEVFRAMLTIADGKAIDLPSTR